MVPNNAGLLHHHTLVTRSYTLPNAISVSNKPQKRAAPNQYADCPSSAISGSTTWDMSGASAIKSKLTRMIHKELNKLNGEVAPKM